MIKYTKQYIDIITEIRNLFAHRFYLHASFDTPEIKEKCHELNKLLKSGIEGTIKTPKQCFLDAVKVACDSLMRSHNRDNKEQTEDLKLTLELGRLTQNHLPATRNLERRGRTGRLRTLAELEQDETQRKGKGGISKAEEMKVTVTYKGKKAGDTVKVDGKNVKCPAKKK